MESFSEGTMCLFGGVRVPDGTMSLFHSSKKTTKYILTFVVEVGFQMVS